MATDESQPPEQTPSQGEAEPEEPLHLKLPDSATTSRIGGFELLQKIGEGGMGVVWKARQLSLDRVVALKVLNPEYSKSSEFLERFRNEARSAANLSHRHIIQVYDAGYADNSDYLAMEYVEGRTVRALLDAEGPMPESVALDTVIPVAQALHYAWERAKLIHRDVKPENILIDQDGTVKLGDLGLAKSAAAPQNLKITRAGQTLGTPHYISPEQAEAKRDLDLRSDIYSLGATLYHMVTGHALFEESPTAQVMLKHVEDVVPDAREYQPQLSEGLCMVIERMLAKDRDDRYPNWQELISDMQLVRSERRPVNARIAPGRSTMTRVETTAAGGPLSEAGPLLSVRPQRWAMTPAMWIGVTVITVCIAGIGVLWFFNQKREEERKAQISALQTEAHAAAAAKAYYEAMEFARSRPNDIEEIVKRFDALLRDYPQTEFAAPANEQLTQWRQKLAAAQQAAQQQAAKETAAKEAAAKTAAQQEAASKQAVAKEAENQRAAELVKAREARRQAALEAQQAQQTAYNEFLPVWTGLLARRDYAGAAEAARKAAAEPRLAGLKKVMTSHAMAAERVRGFVEKMTAPDSSLIGKPVALSTASGNVTGVSDTGGLLIERVAGVAVTVPVLTASSEDLMRLAFASVATGDVEGQLNYALLLMAEGHAEPALAALGVITAPETARFKAMLTTVLNAQNEQEAPNQLADLRAQLAANQWPAALARMLAIDTRFINTSAVQASAAELDAARDQLLSLTPDATMAEPIVHLALITARRAIQAGDWQRALTVVSLLDLRLASGVIPSSVSSALQPEIDEVRGRVMDDSGLPAADVLRRRNVHLAGGRVWTVLADGSGDAKNLAEAVASAKDHDGIELGPGKHEAATLDGSLKKKLLIYGQGGSLPIITDSSSGAASRPGNYLLRCGDGWRLENLHFQFPVTALSQTGPGLTVACCAFSRPKDAVLPGLVLVADCDGSWHTLMENCLFVAPASDALFSQPRQDSVTRHAADFEQCTFWLPDGAVHTTGQPAFKRQDLLTIVDCVVLAQRVVAPTWPKALMSDGFVYNGDRNLLFLARHADDTPSLGDEQWKSLYPNQDAASVVNELTAAMLANLRRGQPAGELAAFAQPASSDLRLAPKSPGAKLAGDKGPVGARWPQWRWKEFLATAPVATPVKEPVATVGLLAPSAATVARQTR